MKTFLVERLEVVDTSSDEVAGTPSATFIPWINQNYLFQFLFQIMSDIRKSCIGIFGQLQKYKRIQCWNKFCVRLCFIIAFAISSCILQFSGKLGKHFQMKIHFRLKASHRPSHIFLYFNCLEIYKPAEMQTGLVLRRALRKLSWGERTGNWNSKHLGRLWGQKMWNTLENCRKFGKEEKIRIFWFKPRRIVGTRDERIRAAQIQW